MPCVAALVAAVVWWAGLALLALPIAYVQDAPYGGFPYIGNGQTVLKHLELGAVALALWAHWSGRAAALRTACWGLWAGQLLVLVWIALTKFTHYEALGVEGLMQSSPLFSWLYGLFDVRGASNLIGVIELLTAALIALWPWRPRWGALGLAMAVVTYVLTTTFLFTTPGWEAAYGAPVVGGFGQFLLKDLGLNGRRAAVAGAACDRMGKPGMIITVEAWYYNHDRCVSMFTEDVILITATGHENLTAQIARSPEGLERLMRAGR